MPDVTRTVSARDERRLATIVDDGEWNDFGWAITFVRLAIRWEHHIENFFGTVQLRCVQILGTFVGRHSYRSATMGSTFVALRAGT